MTDGLVVLIGEDVAGRLVRDRGGRLTFTYDDAYRDRPRATPLSVSMPTPVRVHTDHTITPWLRGLLPDNPDVLERWARRYQVSAASPFALLATPVGRDCAGAVRFVPPDELDAARHRPARVRWLTDGEVAERLRELRRDASSWLGGDFAGRFSLAGAQAKTALVREGARWGLPSGAAATSHILKPAIVGLDGHDLNEHLCLRAAALAGLPAARSEIVHVADETALAVERFDRLRRGRTLLRIHQEDLCQALGVVPTGKYQADGGPGPADVARLLRRVVAPTAVAASVGRFADALVWNWLIAGTDAHAKNYALLLAGDQVRLAPLYDVASALPYGAHERQLRLAMKLGDRGYGLNGQRASTWATLAGQLGLTADEVHERAVRVVRAGPDAFADARAELPPLDTDLPRRLTDAVTERAGRCLAALGVTR